MITDEKLEGVKLCIESLRSLGEKFRHEREWHHSRDSKFAPVELSDWLLIHVYRKLQEEKKNDNG